MLCEIDYPLLPGKGGIDMSRVLFPGHNDFKSGASGRFLRFEISERSVLIEDAKKPLYCLQAWVHPGSNEISFDFHTKVPWYESEIHRIQGRHPDFFASKFIDAAFIYFRSQGVRIDPARGYWLRESDNFRDFMRSVQSGKTMIDAANSTWTGRQYARHSLSVVREDDISSDPKNHPVVVIATFQRVC